MSEGKGVGAQQGWGNGVNVYLSLCAGERHQLSVGRCAARDDGFSYSCLYVLRETLGEASGVQKTDR